MSEAGVILRRVSRVAVARANTGCRVTYAGPGGSRCAPETLVVKRCRAAGYAAFRLPPYLWSLLGLVVDCLPPRSASWPAASDVERALAQLVPDLCARSWSAPSIEVLQVLLATLPEQRLAQLIHRHRSGDVDPQRPGVPDLLVFRRVPGSLVGQGLRFVEVKRPGERLAPHQRAEIQFMRQLGMKAGVLRLLERPEA